MTAEHVAQADENPWMRRILCGGFVLTGVGGEVVAVLEIQENGLNAASIAKGVLGVGAIALGFMANGVFKRPVEQAVETRQYPRN